MQFFAVGKQFDSFKSLMKKKNKYEVATNNLLVIGDSHRLKGEGTFQQNFVYDRFTLNCKAGKERPTHSTGVRKSATYKKGCPATVRTECLFIKSKLS